MEVTCLECPGGVDLLQVFHCPGGEAVLESALPVACGLQLARAHASVDQDSGGGFVCIPRRR